MVDNGNILETFIMPETTLLSTESGRSIKFDMNNKKATSENVTNVLKIFLFFKLYDKSDTMIETTVERIKGMIGINSIKMPKVMKSSVFT